MIMLLMPTKTEFSNAGSRPGPPDTLIYFGT